MKSKYSILIVIIIILAAGILGYNYYQKNYGLLPAEKNLESYNQEQGTIGIDYDYQGPNIENPITPRSK